MLDHPEVLIERIRRDHEPTTWGKLARRDEPDMVCSVCRDEAWPCDAVRAADLLVSVLSMLDSAGWQWSAAT
jgi:hypothetical protein